MAPTTITGQKTTTTSKGREIKSEGHPLKVAELLASIEGVSYLQRVSVDSYPNLQTAKKAIMKSLSYQLKGRGFSLVEILSPCPTDWGMTPTEAAKWIRATLSRTYPLGLIKDLYAEAG